MVNVELNETFPETSDTNNDHTWTRIRVDTAPRQLRLRLVLENVSVWLRFPERMPWAGVHDAASQLPPAGTGAPAPSRGPQAPTYATVLRRSGVPSPGACHQMLFLGL
jgi:hypothetical protein